jgi:4-aminobutyrate aminotransferase/(S)-3-amino-2-methylpropionate transaminase
VALTELYGKCEIIGEVRGLGAMLALELVADRASKKPAADAAKKLTGYCRERGLIILDCGTLGNNIRTLMPLTITPEQLAKGLRILEDGLKQVTL